MRKARPRRRPAGERAWGSRHHRPAAGDRATSTHRVLVNGRLWFALLVLAIVASAAAIVWRRSSGSEDGLSRLSGVALRSLVARRGPREARGRREAGAPLVEHPDVAVISFTGSCEVGRWIAETAGRRLAKTCLELGGKNPLIVCDDADVKNAVTWAIGYHILSFIPITVIGAYYFVRLGLHFRDIGTATERAT